MKIALVLAALVAVSWAATDVTNEMVALHNADRAKHKAGPVTGNSDLAEIAKICAQRNADRENLDHDCTEADAYGENLAGGSDVAGGYKMWYNERKKYNYRKGGFSMQTGHFTQVVWNGTREIGCASADNVSSAISCLYNPPGNYKGEFQKNVFPRGDE